MAIVDAVADRGDGLEAAGHGIEIADLLKLGRAIFDALQRHLVGGLLPLDGDQLIRTGSDELGLGHRSALLPLQFVQASKYATTNTLRLTHSNQLALVSGQAQPFRLGVVQILHYENFVVLPIELILAASNKIVVPDRSFAERSPRLVD
ncbi:hypothetical protein ABH853_22005 [Pseudomonas sp. 13.2]|uniref:Uncharacterized protein n=1 Tax=Pseudomonas sp. 13.2 TaxID=3144665 RepID=A0AAU7BF25_9PSED